MSDITPNTFTDLLAGDLRRHKDGPFNWLSVISFLRRPSFAAVFLYRLSFYFASKKFFGKWISSLLYNINVLLYKCDISPKADIGPGLKLPHPMGVVVGPIKAGTHVTFLQNSTLDMEATRGVMSPSQDNSPVLGNNVIISPGVIVLGKVILGHGVIVGANAVVQDNMPDNAIVGGLPARVLKIRSEAS